MGGYGIWTVVFRRAFIIEVYEIEDIARQLRNLVVGIHLINGHCHFVGCFLPSTTCMLCTESIAACDLDVRCFRYRGALACKGGSVGVLRVSVVRATVGNSL